MGIAGALRQLAGGSGDAAEGTRAAGVVDRYNSAIGAGDLASARQCLADVGFSFSAPIGEYGTADDFVNNVWGVIGILEGIDLERRFVEGAEVLDILSYRTRFDEPRSTSVVQWCAVEGDRIVRMRLYFDAHDYKSMFEG